MKVRYKDPESDASKLIVRPLSAEPTSFQAAAKELQFAASVAAFAMLLSDSKHKGAATFDWVTKIARISKGPDRHGHRGEFLKLVRTAKGLREREE